MSFDNHAFECSDTTRDSRVITRWDGARIEEAPAIVKLDLPRRWHAFARGHCSERVIDLRRNRARRHRLRQRVLPQIAHQATPGTLTIGEENGGDGNNLTGVVGFGLQQKSPRSPR